MDPRKLTDGLSVSPQITPEDVAEVAKLGFRSIICNRPDDEVPDQPPYQTIAAAAAEAGLEFRFIPIVGGTMTGDDIAAFATALEEMSGPVFAYCRSGTRSTTLWSLASVPSMDISEIVTLARSAGYDLSGMIGQLEMQRGG